MKQAVFRMAGAIALLAVGQAQAAVPKARPAPPRPCMTNAEVHGLVAYFLPNVLRKVAGKCYAAAPADGYLRTGLPDLVSRLEVGREAAWPQAKAGFLKFAGDDKDAKTMTSLPDAALRGIVDQVISEKLSLPMTPAICGEANDIAEALAPLTAEQSVHLVATILNAAGRNDKSLNTCPRQG